MKKTYKSATKRLRKPYYAFATNYIIEKYINDYNKIVNTITNIESVTYENCVGHILHAAMAHFYRKHILTGLSW